MTKTVFISSTYNDLANHRRAVWSVLEGFRVAVKGMEQFGARTEAPLETCLAEVEQSDVYVGVIAFKLGSVDSQAGKSFTQLEYERAVQLRKIILIYLADEDAALVRYQDVELDLLNRERLSAFKTTLKERHTVSTFSTPEDLAEKLKRDFARHLETKEQTTGDEEFDSTIKLVHQFCLRPGTFNGREIRLTAEFFGEPFPAARGLCEAFNLRYGSSVGAEIRVRMPTDSRMSSFKEIYAAEPRVTQFLALAALEGPVDLYAQLQFTEKDVPRTHAEFFGFSYYPWDYDEGDPNERFVPAEGRIILLFSKAPVGAALDDPSKWAIPSGR